MARGKLLKTKIKEEKQLLRAKTKEEWRLAKLKPLYVSFRQHVGKMIDKVEVTDGMKIVAVIGMTIIVKNIIEASEDLIKKAYEYSLGLGKIPIQLVAHFLPVELKTKIEKELVTPMEKFPTFVERGLDVWQIEIMEWLVSFTLAYLIVEHFGEIMRATGDVLTSIKGLVSGMLTGGVGVIA